MTINGNCDVLTSYVNQPIEQNKRPSVSPTKHFARFERTPDTDEICLNVPKKKNFFHRLGEKIKDAHKKEVQSREIAELNKTCEKLIDNLQETQKTFQEVFLRNDISEEETLDMIKRYHQIELAGITGSKDEYTYLIFEEVKKNFGLANIQNSLELKSGKIGKHQKTLAYTTPIGDVIMRNDLTRKEIFNVIHHELRHVKQNYYAFNYNPEEFVRLSQPKNMEIPKEIFEIAYDCTPDITNIEEENLDFAKKSFD